MDPNKIMSILEKEYPSKGHYLNFKNSFQLLIATILSAQVQDKVVNDTTKILFKKYKTPNDFADSTPSKISKDINNISLHNNKAKYIHGACKMLVKEFYGKIPKNINDLMKLPGVGKKSANAIIQNAFNIVEGIVCDTHVLRISYRLGWTNLKNAKKVEEDLMDLLNKKHWGRVPQVMKDHGRKICVSKPKCDSCIIKNYCLKVGVQQALQLH